MSKEEILPQQVYDLVTKIKVGEGYDILRAIQTLESTDFFTDVFMQELRDKKAILINLIKTSLMEKYEDEVYYFNLMHALKILRVPIVTTDEYHKMNKSNFMYLAAIFHAKMDDGSKEAYAEGLQNTKELVKIINKLRKSQEEGKEEQEGKEGMEIE